MCVEAYLEASFSPHLATWFSCLRCWRECCRIAPLDTLLQLRCVNLLDLALGAVMLCSVHALIQLADMQAYLGKNLERAFFEDLGGPTVFDEKVASH